MTVRPFGDMLVSVDHAAWIEQALAYISSERVETLISSEQFAATSGDFWGQSSRFRPYLVENGVLTVPVHGILLNDFPFTFFGMATGYEYIEAAVARGVSDPAVTKIVLDVNSPGGIVTGCFDCTDAIYAMRGQKPIIASVNDHGYSAAYAVASAANEIVVSRTGGVGSIGVVTAHLDYSGSLEQRGVKVTFVYAGAHKIDGRPEMPLSDQAKQSMQERIDSTYAIFVATVARNRGLSEEAVRGTEAAVYTPKAAVEAGLADKAGSLAQALSVSADTSNPNHEDEDQMTTPNPQTVAQADHESAVNAATQAGRVEGAAAERGRITAILGCAEAKDRPAAAMSVAMDTDMSVEKATAFLAKLPKETTEASAPEGGNFNDLMSRSGNPNLGAETPAPGGQAATGSRAAKVFASAGYGPAKA